MVLRHGKSLRGPEYPDDYSRPLAPRGAQAARTMGRLLAEDGPEPALIVTSPAQRAVETARLIQAELEDVPLKEEPDVYAASMEDLLKIVAGFPSDAARVLLVGHNPGLEELVADLTGRGDVLLKTCTLALVKLHGESWEKAAAKRGSLQDLINPRELEELA